MMRTGVWCCAVVLLAAACFVRAEESRPLRYPAVPLVACDPYFSIWSNADHLTDDVTRHWTGRPHPLTSLVRVDGKSYRLMGAEPKDVPPFKQTAVEVTPTRSIYRFADAGLELTLTFLTAALPDDLMVLSRPVTYLSWECRSVDGKEHAVNLYFDTTADIAVNDLAQKVSCSRQEVRGLVVHRIGTIDQPILRKKGDDLRIDWGYYYVAIPENRSSQVTLAQASASRKDFVANGGLLPTEPETSRPAKEAPAIGVVFALDKVGATPIARWLMLAYDEVYSIQYFRKNLRPYWRKEGAEAADLLKAAAHDYPALCERCAAFDRELVADLQAAGGEKYARIGALAYRECLAGNHLAADANGRPLLFPKENTSNGCIGTVDVIYPMAPQFLLFGPTLTKAMLISNLDYASSPRWEWPFAPHDLGTYPQANGQVYGGGERTEENQMPVEESGNMLILVAALARMEGINFAAPYWPVLRRWAEYLRAKGFDPENQLCTDDFAGHLAHNVNLSAKAIVALGAYAYLCELRGEKTEAASYRKLAKEYAARWLKEADDGDHFRLTFNGPKTWSQKYNLVWDRLLGLDLFPPDALRKEMAFYKTHQNRYGLPLDSRKEWTKLDWTLWTATLTGERDDFLALVDPVYEFLDKTPNRVPMSDFYWTKDARDAGMHARPVVGGVFLKLLYDERVWKKWAGRDRTPPGAWAPLPTPPEVTPVVPASEKVAAVWHYTTAKPAADWFKPGFDASEWKEGPAGFGAGDPPGSVVRTPWKTDDIWLIREVTLPEGKWHDLQCWVHHDEDVEVYINGVLALREPGYLVAYEAIPLLPAGKAALKPGRNRIAVHCHQTTGGQYIDLGFVDVRP